MKTKIEKLQWNLYSSKANPKPHPRAYVYTSHFSYTKNKSKATKEFTNSQFTIVLCYLMCA